MVPGMIALASLVGSVLVGVALVALVEWSDRGERARAERERQAKEAWRHFTGKDPE